MQTPLDKVLARREELADQRIVCCCFFYGSGKGKELGFWDNVLGHYEKLNDKSGNTIKDSILYVLDDKSPNTEKFSSETKALIKAISGRDVGHQHGEPTLLLNGGREKKEFWVEKKF